MACGGGRARHLVGLPNNTTAKAYYVEFFRHGGGHRKCSCTGDPVNGVSAAVVGINFERVGGVVILDHDFLVQNRNIPGQGNALGAVGPSNNMYENIRRQDSAVSLRASESCGGSTDLDGRSANF